MMNKPTRPGEDKSPSRNSECHDHNPVTRRSPDIDVPIALPCLPTIDDIAPYLRQIDANRWYTNQGPLCDALQARLGHFWGMDYDHVALVTSATTGITLALKAHGVRPGSHCLMPSWTFTASAAAVMAAHLQPHFVDVRADTWCPDPTEVETLARSPEIGAILIIVPFGAPLDLAIWDAIAARTGRPVIIDAAAAFDTLRADGPMPVGQCTVVVSLHATKVFGVGEGGAVLSRDPALAEHIRALARFGFSGSRSAQHPGINAKISEYTAAVGLAGLDLWPETRRAWQSVTNLYRTHLPSTLGLPPTFGEGWVSSTLTALWPGNAQTLAKDLAAQGIGTVSWWGTGCHTQPAYAASPQEALPLTEEYGRCAIGLPFWQGMGAGQVARVCTALQNLLPEGADHLVALSAE